MNREFWIGLIVGLLIGWIVEWIIDRLYWRKKFSYYQQQLENTKDNLRDIKGVGKILEERLNNAGIYTFESLAALTRENLEKIVGDAKNLADEADLIRRARKKAKKKQKK